MTSEEWKMRIQPLFVLAILFLGSALCAQTTVTLGTPNSSSNIYPFSYGTPGAGRYHVSYSSTEIGLTSGAQLLEVQVQITGTVPTTMGTYNNFQLRCAHTTLAPTALTATYANNYTGTLTTCLGPTNHTPATVVAGSYTYARFPLSTPFSYNGTQNLLLDFSQDSRTGSGFTISSVGTRMRVWAFGTGTGAATASGSASTSGDWQIRLIFQTGPGITVTATAGTATQSVASSTSQISAGTFTLAANSSGACTLNSITMIASGTGNDSNAYSQVSLYEDTNSSTVFDSGDTLYGTAVTAYPADNGQLTFTASQSFAASQTRRYFVVVRMGGTTLATLGQTFNHAVQAISVTSGTSGGTPSTAMNGVVIVTPTLTVSATAGTAQTVYADATGTGGNGISIGVFTITNGALGAADLSSITLIASGSGNDSNAFSEVGIFEDTNSSTAYDAGDTRYGTAATAYGADNGTLTFTQAQSFAVSQVRRYFVVVKLNGTTLASPGQTFNTAVNSIAVPSTTSSAGTPSTAMNGLTIQAPSFTIADNSSTTQGTGYLGGTNFVIQQFTITYPAGPANTITGISVQASGSGNDQADYASVALYRDANANATYDIGTDVQVNSFTAFPSDNGTQSFTLSGAESQFTAGQTKQYFIVVAFNMNGTNNTNFATQVQSASGASTGTTFTGTPAPASGPTAGLLLLANNLIVTFNGPGAATTVNNNDQGTGGIGRVLFDFSLQTFAAAWTVTDLTFTAQGTANHQTAYNYLALYFDGNSSGGYDAGDTLAVGSAGVAFNGSNQYTATLVNSSFPGTTTRRFFLVGRLAGTATTGQTLNAQLTGSTTTPPSGGTVTTIPTATSTALIIDSPVLSAFNGGAAPAGTMLEGGTAQTHTAAQFAFTASNNPSVLNGITLTTSGTGTWNVDVPAVEIYQDDGNGVYDVADTLIFTGAGATPTIACTFTSAVNIANGATVSIWVRLGFSATAGASVPETFAVSIANAADVSVTGATALLGTPAPTSNNTSVVMFFVTTFAPAFDMQTGGAAITITGSGFLSPVTLTIGGAVCPGTAVIGAGGTQITGLTVPPGTGTNKVIVLSNGALGAKTLTQTFDYAGGSIIGTGGGGGGGGGSGCEANDAGAAWLAALALLAVAASLSLRRRIAR